MCHFAVFRTWLAAVWCLGCVVSSQGVVTGPAVAVEPEVSAGELLVRELNCAACHRGGPDVSPPGVRQSPVLGKEGMRITPQYLRRYLSDPLGYKPGTTMPDLLHHLQGAAKEETVEALVHFLISEQEPVSQPGISAEDYLIRQGRTLYHTAGCVACHEPQAPPEGLADADAAAVAPALLGRASVPLGDLARKTTVQELATFLRDPLKTRPSGRMPGMNLTAGEAASLAVYLLRAQAPGLADPAQRSLLAGLRYQYYEESFGASPDFPAMTPKAGGVAERFELTARKRQTHFGFHFSGNIEIPREGLYTFYTRSDDGSMLYINGKLVVNNGGDHGPEEKRGEIQLAAGRHEIVVTFFNNGGGFELGVFWRGPGIDKQPVPASVLSHYGQPMRPLESADFAVDPGKAAQGRRLFADLGCASCHSLGAGTAAGPGSSTAMTGLRGSSRGCLAEDPLAGIPRWGLTSSQRAAIGAALALPERPSPRAQIVRTFASLNCYACHTRDGKGGPSEPRLAYFGTVGEVDMGDEGRVPPHLTAVGAKLRPDWTHEVLVKGGRVRPYMATRMPQYGEKNVAHLPEVFVREDTSPEEVPPPELTQRDAKFGRRLAGTGGLSCIACHTVGDHKSLGIPAINLAVMSKRLRYDWFARYLADPPWLRPGTRMPTFWPNGEAVNKEILGGDTQAQINALWAYLELKPETDLPPGLIQGKMELVATDEPVIYRNFIRGAGPRAIGVGYPEKVNLAFDAQNVRLAMIWQGSFIDASRHRTGRGEGFEPPLGNNVLAMPEGPQFAILEEATAPWPVAGGKESGFKMGGYRLGEQRRPDFFYTFRDLAVAESFEPVMGEIDAYFKRTIRLSGAPSGKLWFRAAVGSIVRNGDAFVLDGKTLLRFPGAEPVLRDGGASRELLVPVEFHAGEALLTQEIIW